MIRRSLSLMLVSVAASLAFAGSAYASSSAVTGDPWVDQYIEQIPSATGGNSGGQQPKSGLTREQLRALSDIGGDQVAYAIGSAVPAKAKSGSGGSVNPDDSVSVPSAAASLTTALQGDSGGLGLVLPAALLGSVLGAFALAFSRQHRNRS